LKKQQDSIFFYATREKELAEKMNKPLLKIIAYIDMGDAYYLTRQHDKVMSYNRRALKLAQKKNAKKLLSDIHLNIAQSHLKLSRQRTKKVLDSAIFHGNKALQFAKTANYGSGIYESSVVLADFLNVNGQHKTALSLIETVIDLPKEKTPANSSFNAPFYYAVILKDNKQYSKAKDIVKELISDVEKDQYSQRASLYFFLSALYAYNNQPDSTDFAIKQAIIARNANDEVRVNKKIVELQTQYETQKKEQEIKSLEQQRRLEKLKIKNLQVQRYILLFFLLLLLVGGGWFLNRRRLMMKLETEQKEYAKQMSEQKALRSQMNPHFIFNALNSIQQYIIINQKDKVSDYLGNFADLIRRYLSYSSKKSISLTEEVEALKIYLNLETLRFEEDFHYYISLSTYLDADSVHIPCMIVQPYIENAIRHGLLHKKGKRQLLVSFAKGENDTILCIIEDNGIGRKKGFELSQKRNQKHKSFAEKATHDRLQLFNLMKNDKVGVTIIDLFDKEKNTGTKVVINLPILT
jgi:two-component sensor histidine kinase